MNWGVAFWTVTGFAAIVVSWLYVHEVDTSHPRPAATATASASASAAAAGGAGGAPPDAGAPDAVPAGGSAPFALDAGLTMGAGDLPDLGDAPKSIKFGCVLLRYKGAQGSKRDTRSKADAKALAEKLLPLAKETFADAVKEGDKGSQANAGKMYRHILEPNVEYALFRLEKGEVSDIIDTPRGYWIAKRID